ncbi:MAG TPA: biotin-dependent carboxyltransferase family protein [Opitutaceae bacterium]|nr:biotin-dependent carboxyltransferase family protein [Opitutaceae bacterium]
MIHVEKAGLLTTVQDLGRSGSQHLGVPVSGAMDEFAHRTANLLVGNQETDATLEITLNGPTLRFERDALISICGGNLSPSIDAQEIPMGRPLVVRRGSRLKFGAVRYGCRSYLAVEGGLKVDCILGSRSTCLRASFGGFSGRALRAGDTLPFDEPSLEIFPDLRKQLRDGKQAWVRADWFLAHPIQSVNHETALIHVTAGPQMEWFSEESQKQFIEQTYTISDHSDRMGYRLSGEPITLTKQRDLLSEGVAFGTIQIPADGQPIVLMADHATTGGYPKIANVAAADLPIVAQLAPHRRLKFELIPLSISQKMLVTREHILNQLRLNLAARRGS